MVSTIFLVRHAEAEANVNETYDGWHDTALTPLEVRVSRELGARRVLSIARGTGSGLKARRLRRERIASSTLRAAAPAAKGSAPRAGSWVIGSIGR